MESTVGKSIMDFNFGQVVETCKSFLNRWTEYKKENEGSNISEVGKILSDSCVELENIISTLKIEELTVEKRNKIRLLMKETERHIALAFC